MRRAEWWLGDAEVPPQIASDPVRCHRASSLALGSTSGRAGLSQYRHMALAGLPGASTVRCALQPGLTQHPSTAGSGAAAASSTASMRTSRAATAGRRSRVFAICLGEYPAARSSRTRSGTCVSTATPRCVPFRHVQRRTQHAVCRRSALRRRRKFRTATAPARCGSKPGASRLGCGLSPAPGERQGLRPPIQRRPLHRLCGPDRHQRPPRLPRQPLGGAAGSDAEAAAGRAC